ncbi:MAG: hypothetical protein PVI30_12690 [Myxococcales bacterium]
MACSLGLGGCGGSEEAPFFAAGSGGSGMRDGGALASDGGATDAGDGGGSDGGRGDAPRFTPFGDGDGTQSGTMDGGVGQDAVPDRDAGPVPVDPCDDEVDCGGFVFGDDLPEAGWLTGFNVIADAAAFVGPDATSPIASRFRDQNNLHVTADGTVLLWDAATLLQPDDNFLFQIGEVLVLRDGVFETWKIPADFTAEVNVPMRQGEDALHIRAMDVRRGSNEVTLLSQWTYRPNADGSDTEDYLLLATYEVGAGLQRVRRFVGATRLDMDVGDNALRVDAYGRMHVFDQEAARIVDPGGGVLLDVEGWYWANFHGFAVDDNGVIYQNADDGGADERIETVDRASGDKQTLVTKAQLQEAASSYVGGTITPPIGAYRALPAGILGATSEDAHTLVYAISGEGEIRILTDIGGGGFVYGLDYLPASGALYILRNDENNDPEIIHNGR